MGLLLLSLLQGSRFVLFGWQMHSRLVEQDADLDAIDRMLRHLIEQASPGSEWEPLLFVGTPHAVTFTSRMPATSAPGRTDVELAVDAAHRLVLVSTPHLHAIRTGQPAKALTTEILQGIERLDLAYWPAGQNHGWSPAWHDEAPPRLVRIRIVFADPNHPPWPDIVAAPMLDPP